MNFKKSFQMSPEMRNVLPVENKKPTKNFLIENIKNLREMQHQMEAARSALPDKAKKFQKPPKKRSAFTIKKVDERNKWVPLPSSEESISKRSISTKSQASKGIQYSSPPELAKKYSDQAVQTSPPIIEKDEQYSETMSTVISRPSTTATSPRSLDESTTNAKERAINKMLKDTGVNFVELNRRRTTEYKRKTKDKADSAYRIPSNYQLGVLPKYLKDKKSVHTQERKTEQSNECPVEINMNKTSGEHDRPGHILLSDEERLEHLKIMKKCYEDLSVQFNQLPIRNDSLKAKQKRADLEKQLQNLEKSMNIFSRERLYIKL